MTGSSSSSYSISGEIAGKALTPERVALALGGAAPGGEGGGVSDEEVGRWTEIRFTRFGERGFGSGFGAGCFMVPLEGSRRTAEWEVGEKKSDFRRVLYGFFVVPGVEDVESVVVVVIDVLVVSCGAVIMSFAKTD